MSGPKSGWCPWSQIFRPSLNKKRVYRGIVFMFSSFLLFSLSFSRLEINLGGWTEVEVGLNSPDRKKSGPVADISTLAQQVSALRISGCFVFAFCLCSQKQWFPGSYQIRARKWENQDLLIFECIRCLRADLLTECALSLLGIVSLILATGLQAAPDWPLPEWVARERSLGEYSPKSATIFRGMNWFDRAKKLTARNYNH